MSGRVFARVSQTVLGACLVLGAMVPRVSAQAAVQGQWSTLNYTAIINPIHVALMHNGKILMVAGSGNCPASQSGCPAGPPYGGSNHSGAVVLDPVAKSFTQLSVGYDMFCEGMTLLPDGRVLIAGGTIQYDPFLGSQQVSIFDPSSNSFSSVQNMAHGRWYPNVTLLSDGRVMAFSGLNDTNGGTNSAVEFYTVGSGWSSQYNAPFTPPLYPRMHLLPSGNVFFSGSSPTSYLFNPSSKSWSTVDNTNYGSTRTYGSSVLFPLTPDNGYDPQVMILGGDNPATATTEIIDLGGSSQWQWGPSMSQARTDMVAILLPNGKILAMGGSASDEDGNTASLHADLYDPASNSFSSAGSNAYARLYHTVGLLLPDATVWLAGGNPTRGTYESHMEIYKPAYLFNSDGSSATRPTIASAPASIGWGGQFSVSTPDAANITQAVLVRPGSSTHSFDLDQRLVGMSFTAGSGSLTLTAPPNSNIAPPGYYMLFLINSQGVPSTAAFVLLNGSGSAPAPSVSSVSPNSGSTSGGTGVTITGANFVSGATATFGGTAATNVTVVSSTSITAKTSAHAAGAVTVVVTNSDSQTGTLSNGYTYTNPAPTVTSVSPNSGSTNGGAGVTVTGTNFLSGATVTIGGTAATGITVVSSTSITATTPAHAAGAASVVVTNTDGQTGTLSNGYTYGNPAPTVTSASPNSGLVSGGTAVTITGTNFLAGATVSFGGTAATGVTVASSTSITATTPAHAAGAVNVVVTNSGGQSGTLSNGFTYNNLAPAVTSLSPSSGPIGGGTAVTITGTNFQAAATVTFGAKAATGVTVVSATSITATTPAASAAGAVSVVVTNSNGLSGALANGYTYFTPVDFTLTAAALAPGTVPPGGSATSAITINPVNGFSGDVTLSCGAITPVVTPPPACAFSPSSMANPGTSTLTVHTTAAKQTYLTPQSRSILYAMFLPIGGLLLLGSGLTQGNKKRFRSLIVGLLFSSSLFLASCGGGSSPPAGNSGGTSNAGTPVGTYNVTVTGVSGSLVHTAAVTLTVN